MKRLTLILMTLICVSAYTQKPIRIYSLYTEHYAASQLDSLLRAGGCKTTFGGKSTGRTIYVYRGGSSILYGEQINLLYNGYYRVRRGNTWYLADENGNLVSGIYGKDLYYYPFGYVAVQRNSGYWDIFHCSGRKVECYSNESPYIFWNGYFLIKQGTYWYAVDDDGNKIDGVYGDKVTLLNDGSWKCVRGSYVTYIN